MHSPIKRVRVQQENMSVLENEMDVQNASGTLQMGKEEHSKSPVVSDDSDTLRMQYFRRIIVKQLQFFELLNTRPIFLQKSKQMI